MGLFNKKKEKTAVQKYAEDPQWYLKELYAESFVMSDDKSMAVVTDMEYEGICNGIDIIPFIEKKGWVFITVAIDRWDDRQAQAEYIFRRKT